MFGILFQCSLFISQHSKKITGLFFKIVLVPPLITFNSCPSTSIFIKFTFFNFNESKVIKLYLFNLLLLSFVSINLHPPIFIVSERHIVVFLFTLSVSAEW